MNLVDLNKVLYRCDQEERDETANKFGVYDIPNYGPLVYAGFQGAVFFKVLLLIIIIRSLLITHNLGVISLLTEVRPNNDLGHPLCNNLREGNWLIGKIFKIRY